MKFLTHEDFPQSSLYVLILFQIHTPSVAAQLSTKVEQVEICVPSILDVFVQ